MLLSVGIAMALCAVALATVVAVVVNLSGTGKPSTPGEARSEETMSEPARQKREVQELPAVSDDWPQPSGEEGADTREPRYYQPQQNAALTLTIEEIDLYDVPVIDGATEEALEEGAIHFLPDPDALEGARAEERQPGGPPARFPQPAAASLSVTSTSSRKATRWSSKTAQTLRTSTG